MLIPSTPAGKISEAPELMGLDCLPHVPEFFPLPGHTNLFPPVKLHCPQVLGLESLSVLISGYKTTDITTQGKEQTNQQIINGLNSPTMISAEEIGLRSLTSQPYVPGVNDKDNRIATKGITGSLY